MTDTRPLISVIIPAYNEETHISATLRDVIAYLEGLGERYRWEIVVVDDGSSDGTLEAIRALAATEPRLRAAPQPSNFNLGQSLRYGFSVAEGDYLVTLDADLSYSPEHIGRLIEVLDTTEAKVVIASPYMEGGTVTGVPTSRLVASKAANRLLSVAAKGDLTTVTGMVRGIRRRVPRGPRPQGHGCRDQRRDHLQGPADARQDRRDPCTPRVDA